MICPIAEAFKDKGFQEWVRVHRLNLNGDPIDGRVLELQRSSQLLDTVPTDPADCAACYLLMGHIELQGTTEGRGCQRSDCRTVFGVRAATPETERQNPLRLQINLKELGINIF